MRLTREQTATIKKAITAYGIETQTDKAIDDMLKLTDVLKAFKQDNTAENYEQVHESLADVWIMMYQLLCIYGDSAPMSDVYNVKTARSFLDLKLRHLRHELMTN